MYSMKENEIFPILECKYGDEDLIYNIKKKSRVLINNWYPELIGNLISTNLCSGLTTIVVGNKDNVTEIKNMLGSIDSRLLYFKTRSQLNKIKSTNDKSTSKIIKSKLEVLSRDIDRKINILDMTKEIFSRQRECGLSLLDMYEKTNKKLTQYDDKYQYYIDYKDKRIFQKYKYNEFLQMCNGIVNKNITDIYIKYRRFSNNKIFLKLKDEIKVEDINLANYKISSLLKNEWAFILPMNNNEYSKAFMDLFIDNREISDEALYDLAEKVYEENQQDSDEDNNIFDRLFSIFSSSQYEKSNKKEEEINIIYDEFLDDKENLNIFINAFNFIKNVLNDEEYQIFIRKLLEEDEIVEYLTSVKNAINIYESFKEVTVGIQMISNEEREILDYCYDNLEKKDEIEKLVEYLPEIYLYVYLEDIEETEKDNINNYKEFEYIRSDIISAIESKKDFTKMYIDSYWNECSNNILKENFCDIEDIDYDYIRCVYPCLFIEQDNDELYELLGSYCPECFIVLDSSKVFVLNYIEEDDALTVYDLNYDLKDLEKKVKYTNLQKNISDVVSKLGYNCIKNVICQNYSIDLLIVSKENEKKCLAIEIDKSIYSLDDYSVRNYDIYRKYILENNDIELIRVWSRDWWNDKREEITKLKYILKI